MQREEVAGIRMDQRDKKKSENPRKPRLCQKYNIDVQTLAIRQLLHKLKLYST